MLEDMLEDKVSLDDIRTGAMYDLVSLYQETEDDTSYNNSPFQYSNTSCEYFEPDKFVSMLDSLKSHTSFFHLNCRGLSSNWDSFKDLICNLHTDKFAFDFIGMSELFRIDGDMRLRLPGYHPLLSRTRDDGPRGGVGLFVKGHINYTVRNDLSVFIPHIFESVFIEIEIKKSQNLIVGVIYRPNTQPLADMDVFQTTLHDIMHIINGDKKTGVILGDMNVDILKFNSHHLTGDYLDRLFSCGFLPVIVKPTRVTTSSATLIDHIYINDIATSGQSGIIITDIADHFGTFYILTENSLNHSDSKRIFRSFSERNVNLFVTYLENCDFIPINNINCPDEAYKAFMELYRLGFEQCFPLCQSRNNTKHIKRELWCSRDLLMSLKKKKKLFSKKLSKPTEANIITYKTHNAAHKKLRRKTKQFYYKNILEESKQDIKKTWTILNKLLGKISDKSGFPNNFIINDKSENNRQIAANAFNNFFSKIGLETNHNVPKSNKCFKSYMPNPLPNSIFIDPVSPSAVINVIHKLKPKTSFGHDSISTKLLKATICQIIQPLTYIINKSFETGIVPADMKIAKVVPVHKSSDQTLLKNYRPISLLPAFSKVIEKLMFNKIVSFFNANSLFYKHQYGFRSKHSTIHPIIHLLNHCADSINKTPPEYTLSIFCDLSKAFDVIDHKILIYKLRNYGIRGIANKWCHNYLTNRAQYVELDGKQSSQCNIECGVPQGSILGPLLYLIYVNDISNCCDSNILSFADDTTLYLSDSDLNRLFVRANLNAELLFDWFCSNRLSLNAGKTKYIVIRPKHLKGDVSNKELFIRNTKVVRIGNNCQEKSTKFLGIYIDEHLTWKEHLSQVNKKVSCALFSMKQVKHIIPVQCLKSLYHTLVNSHLSYGILAWGNANKTSLKRTITLQKRAIRIVNDAKYNSHTEPLFKRNRILKLTDLYEHQVVLFMSEFINNTLPASFDNTFLFNINMPNARRTRQSELVYEARCKSQFASNLPLFVFPKIWNKWAHEINTAISRSSIKKHVCIKLLESYNVSVRCNNPLCNNCNS